MVNARQQAYLAALGIDNYYVEKTSVELEPVLPREAAAMPTWPAGGNGQGAHARQLAKMFAPDASTAATTATETPAESKVQQVTQHVAGSDAAEAEEVPQNPLIPAAFSIELWFSEHVLAVFADVPDAFEPQRTQPLLRNILKAIGQLDPALQALEWPIPMASSTDKPQDFMHQILKKFVVDNKKTPVCLAFGELSLALVAGDAGQFSDLVGTVFPHASGVEIRAAHALQFMCDDPELKAQTWGLIRDLQPNSTLF